jgi:hypothetical protein
LDVLDAADQPQLVGRLLEVGSLATPSIAGINAPTINFRHCISPGQDMSYRFIDGIEIRLPDEDIGYQTIAAKYGKVMVDEVVYFDIITPPTN